MTNAVQANITDYWHLHAVAYDEHPLSQLHMGPAKDAWADVWSSALPPAADILEVGTGTGQVASLLAELGHMVTGIDLAEGMLRLARDKADGMKNPPTLQVADAVAPPFPPTSFDVVASRYLLWTLREPRRALDNWRALLRPGGRLAAIDGEWFAGGAACDEVTRPGGDDLDQPDHEEFLRLYDRLTFASLPLAETHTIDATVALVHDAQFVDVSVTPLPEIERIERALLPDPSGVRPQFLVTAQAG